MNHVAQIVGYFVMGMGTFFFVFVGLPLLFIWLLNISPLKRKTMYILKLGMIDYMKIPKDERKY